jgi:N-acetylneuraminic acid mutarotase
MWWVELVTGSSFTAVSNVDAYNVVANTWAARRAFPGNRYSTNGATPINGKLYVSGGIRQLANGDSKVTKTLFVYDPVPDRWASRADMPLAGFDGVQGLIDGQLYVYAVGMTVIDEFFRYNPSTNTWVELPPPPETHRAGVGGVIGGKFYLTGGPHRSLHIYNPATNSWAPGAPMGKQRFNAFGGVTNGKLYVAGGYSEIEQQELSSVQAYDPNTNRWTLKAPMPDVWFDGASATATGKLFVMGGAHIGSTRQIAAYTP